MSEFGCCGSVLIGSLHELMADGLASILRESNCGDIRVASTPQSLLDAVDARTADVIILDGCMSGDGMGLIRTLVERGHTVVLVVGPDWSASSILQAILAGAAGCFSYDEDPSRFSASIRLAYQGSFVMSRSIGQLMAAGAYGIRQEVTPERLSSREQEIAGMVARGATNREIADSLFISEHTVKIHLGHILEKLNLRNRQQIAAHVAMQKTDS